MNTKAYPQLELELDRARSPQPRLLRRQRRLHRAHWWFEQMRQVVDRAWDREPQQPGRPEQIYFPLRRNA